jgi:flagellar hook assembly protein FlgD
MNYPNPFKTETDFTYVLRNSGKADVKIVIYTVAGHKIRTLKPASTHAGMNALHWDGRDEEGNLLANGTYLYRVVLTSEDEKGGSSTQALTEKAVVSR